MQQMYPGKVNSPQTELSAAIDDTQDTIPLLDASVLPAPPNLATLGTGEDAETVLYTGINGNTLTGVTRGFQGTARAWVAGTKVARQFTAYDHDAFRLNIEEHETRIGQNTAAVQQVAADLAAHLNDFAKLQFGNRPYVSTEDKTYYIDAVNGNDENDGESPATAFKTWAKVESMIPRILHHSLEIRIIGHLPEVISVKGVIIAGHDPGKHRLRIIGDTGIASNHQINGAKFVAVIGTDGGAYVGCVLSYVRSNGIIQINGCTGVIIEDCEPRNFGSIGIQIGHSFVRIGGCDFGANIVQDAIAASSVSRVFTINNVGNATRYGLYASEGSTIFKYDSQPTGTSANEFVYQAGEIK